MRPAESKVRVIEKESVCSIEREIEIDIYIERVSVAAKATSDIHN